MENVNAYRVGVSFSAWLGCKVDDDVNNRNREEHISPLWAEPFSFASAAASEIFPDSTSRRTSRGQIQSRVGATEYNRTFSIELPMN
jgi:hypothetical protein